jgi:hypothetical protein
MKMLGHYVLGNTRNVKMRPPASHSSHSTYFLVEIYSAGPGYCAFLEDRHNKAYKSDHVCLHVSCLKDFDEI